MSHINRRRRPSAEGQSAELTAIEKDMLGGRTEEEWFAWTNAIIASMHVQPGESVPDGFEECPWCRGATCPACDGTGRMHPTRVGYAEDCLFPDLSTVGDFLKALDSGRLTPLQVNNAFVALAPLCRAILNEWLEQDPELKHLLWGV